MARARNIKPGFFKNEQLVELPFEYRILFCGLWVLADREGRLEDRPKRIRMEIFPADDVDVNAGLEALSVSGFITRYAVAGQSYIQIDNFHKHQNPHHKEANSIIPKPEASPGLSPSSIEQQSEARLGQASDSERVDRGVNRADSLIPDSLIPDSKNLAPSAVSESREPSSANAVSPLQAKRTVEEQQLLPSSPAAGRPAAIPPLEAGTKASSRAAAGKTKADLLKQITADAVEAFNRAPFTRDNGGRCPNVKLVNKVREQQVDRCISTASEICLQQYGSPVIGPEFWTDYWATVDSDPFHSGRIAGSGTHASWTPDFEYLTNPKTMTKLFDKAMSGPPAAAQPADRGYREPTMAEITC